jgi:hypothetical protein
MPWTLPKSASPEPLIKRDLAIDWRRRALGLLLRSLAKKGLNLRVITPLVREAVEGRLAIKVPLDLNARRVLLQRRGSIELRG